MTHKSLINQLSGDLGVPREDIERIVRTAPHRYKVFTIPKRKPGEFRTIAQPSYELKVLQRWLVANLISKLPVHPSAMAYKVGAGIRDNACRHVGNSYLMKLDFRQFFPSIKPRDLFLHLNEYCEERFSDADLDTIKRLFFWKRGYVGDYELCIGAPSSPAISNTVMFKFDDALTAYCNRMEVTYTRYADDLTFSANVSKNLPEVLSFVRGIIINARYPKLELNEDKTVFVSKRSKRVVTGLILSSQGDVSLGRERKRLISARIHAYLMNKLSHEEALKLKGHLAFALDVEPEFIGRMRSKYGDAVIAGIFAVS